MIVADANVIAAYCINSTGTSEAKAVFAKDRAWISPKLWQAEFVSVLFKYRKARLISEDEAELSLHLAASLMRNMDYDSDVRDISETAARLSCSVYDACYVSLAEEKKLKLVTKDGGILINASHVAMTPEQFLAA